MANTARMTALQRREQLIRVGRALFASKGFEAVSVEEIAANAKVSKPIVYEHFGGKEGLYAVIVDREMRELTNALIEALSDTKAHPRQIVERAALALLTYIEENSEGFQVLVRDSPTTDPAGSFNSLLGDISLRVEDLLTAAGKIRRDDPHLIAWSIWSAVHGFVQFETRPEHDTPVDDDDAAYSFLLRLLIRGVRTPQTVSEGTATIADTSRS